jgi:hypothetical protein
LGFFLLKPLFKYIFFWFHVIYLILIIFNQDGDAFTITALENTQVLVLAGVPLNEPLETYGPFVMNTTTEIMEAIRDYQTGKMGVLIEEFH